MRIGLVGCGRAGVTILYMLRTHNKLVGVYDSNLRKQKNAIQSLRIMHNPNYAELISQSEAIFIATPDDVIVRAYKKMQSYLNGRKYVFHFSGILPADVLPKKRNVFRASIHPFATFPRIAIPPSRKHLFLSIEGDPQAVERARAIFNSGIFKLRSIRKKDKPLYHLVGVFSSNLLVGFVAAIYESANLIGWREEDLKRLVIPMVAETLNNIKKYGVKDSLSGPLRRGDVKTIEKHLRVLKKNKRLMRIYKDLSLYIVQNLTTGRKKSVLIRLLGK